MQDKESWRNLQVGSMEVCRRLACCRGTSYQRKMIHEIMVKWPIREKGSFLRPVVPERLIPASLSSF